MLIPAKIVDSTTGSASATNTVDDNTASVKDDLATLAAVINHLIDVMQSIHKRLEGLENG